MHNRLIPLTLILCSINAFSNEDEKAILTSKTSTELETTAEARCIDVSALSVLGSAVKGSEKYKKTEFPDYYQQLYAHLEREIIGQPLPVQMIVKAILRGLSGVPSDESPIGSILAFGPTGVGKTETLKAVITFFNGDPVKNLIRVDFNSFMDGHESGKLIGSPAGYAGHDEKPKFHADNVREATFTIEIPSPYPGRPPIKRKILFVLLDEIEKANKKLHPPLMRLIDEGKIELHSSPEAGQNNTNGTSTGTVASTQTNGSDVVDFTHAFFMLTSNAGAAKARQLIVKKKQKIKDHPHADQLSATERDLTGRLDNELRQELFKISDTELRAIFPPEFLSRIDMTLQYDYLDRETGIKIFKKKLRGYQSRIFSDPNTIEFLVELSPNLLNRVADLGAFSEKGGRVFVTILKTSIETKIATLQGHGDIKPGDHIFLDLNPESVKSIDLDDLSEDDLSHYIANLEGELDAYVSTLEGIPSPEGESRGAFEEFMADHADMIHSSKYDFKKDFQKRRDRMAANEAAANVQPSALEQVTAQEAVRNQIPPVPAPIAREPDFWSLAHLRAKIEALNPTQKSILYSQMEHLSSSTFSLGQGDAKMHFFRSKIGPDTNQYITFKKFDKSIAGISKDKMKGAAQTPSSIENPGADPDLDLRISDLDAKKLFQDLGLSGTPQQ